MTLHNIHVTNIPYSFKLSLGYIIRSKTIDIFQTETKVYKASAYKLWSLYSYNLKLLHDTNNLLAIPIARFSSINKTLELKSVTSVTYLYFLSLYFTSIYRTHLIFRYLRVKSGIQSTYFLTGIIRYLFYTKRYFDVI